MKANLKKVLVILLACVTVLSCVACTQDTGTGSGTTANTTATPTEAPTTEAPTTAEEPIDYNQTRMYRMNIDYNKVKLIGRTEVLMNGITCDYSASGIAFTGVMSTVTVMVETNQDTYFTVFVDGERLPDRYKVSDKAGENKFTFTTPGGMDVHEVRIVKQSEIRYTRCLIKSIEVFGAITAPAAQKERYIEFIGDSITCGYGVLGSSSTTNPGSVEYGDATQAYAFLTAEKLDADYSLICCGAIGLGLPENKQAVPFNMPDIYPYVSAPEYRPETPKYQVTRVPDVVVINMGRNDYGKGSEEAPYKEGLKTLIEQVRANYGNVKIVWVTNMMGECCADWTEAALDEWCTANNVDRSMFMMVELPKNTAGAGTHPNVEGQAVAAEQLAAFLLEKIYN